MMGFIHFFVAVLSLLSVGQSAPVNSCESLIQPVEIQGRDQLLGTWTVFGESTNIPMSKELTDMLVDNVWVRVTTASQSDAIDVHQFQKMFGSCFKVQNKITLENNVLSTDQIFNSSARLLNTGCPDCLVSFSQYKIGKHTYSGVQLMSSKNEVSAAELEEFKKQVECLNMPPPAILSQDKGLCPDDSSVIDLTSSIIEMGPKLTNLMEQFLSSESMMKMLTGLMSSFEGLQGI